ncbi:hypothetical protein GmHk_16G046754 [Glycine max]|nr:hypothetical protein GmHk_16G046754 [Glycine max]
MAFAHYLLAVPVEPSPNFPTNPPKPNPSLSSSSSSSISSHCFNLSSSLRPKHSLFSRFRRICHKAKAKPQEPEVTVASDAFTQFKHLLLPITDRNPYLSEVIDAQQKESLPEHETQLSSIRWHLSEGGLKDYNLLERLGDGNKPTAIIGDVADDLNLDLVVISMEAIHTKHIDANLLAEFIPCPVMLLPL